MSPGAGATPSEAATSTSAPASAASASSTKRTRSSRSARSGVEEDGPRSEWMTASQRSAGSRRRSERRKSRRAPRSSCSTKAMRTGASSSRSGRGSGSAPGATIRVLAREEAPQQVGGRSEGRGPRVEAPEDELHDLARDLGGDDALGGRVEGADVERARVAQRRAGHAGREGLVHVAQVERRALEEVGDRARDVDRQRGATAAGQRRQRLAHGQHAHLARGGLDARRCAPRGAIRAPACARTTARRR